MRLNEVDRFPDPVLKEGQGGSGQQEYSAGLREEHANEFARCVRAGEFRDRAGKLA